MNQKINVFCLHFAGGNKYSYRDFAARAPQFINIEPLEAPGRGARMREPLTTDIHLLTSDFLRQLLPRLHQPFALYGHSMGGLVAYLVTRRLAEMGNPLPLHLFITGTPGPSAPGRRQLKRHLLPRQQFVDEIRSLGGMPDEILMNDDMLNFFEPVLRADFTATENYIHQPCNPLPVPITVITGDGEEMEADDIAQWEQESAHQVEFKVLPGNHFFIYDHPEEIMRIIASKFYEQQKAVEI